MLRILSEKRKWLSIKRNLVKHYQCFGEHENKDGLMYGYTENYVRVQKPFDALSINEIELVKLDKIEADGTVSILAAFDAFLAKA